MRTSEPNPQSIATGVIRNYGLGILVLSGILWFRLKLLHLPIDRDEGEFAYAGWRMLQGGIPYLDFYNMKMPGIYAFYSLLFVLFGTGIEAIRIGSILVNLANTWFIYRLGTKWTNERAGYYASLCYLIFSIQVELQGTSTHAEAVAMLFVLWGLLLYQKAKSLNSTGLYFAAGILEGMAVLTKQPAGVFAAWMLLMVFAEPAANGMLRSRFRTALTIVAGTLLPLCLTMLWLASSGAWSQYKLFAFEYARQYISYLTWKDGWYNCVAVLSKAIQNNFFLWLLVAVALLRQALRISLAGARRQLFFFLFSFVAVSAGFYFRPHYFQFLLPSLAILTGELMAALETGLRKRNKAERFVRVITPSLYGVALLIFIFSEKDLLRIKTDEDFIRKIYGQDFFNATKRTGDFIAANTKPGSKLAIFGAEPEIWFYSKRVAASGYLYIYPLLENHHYAAMMKSQFYDEVIRSRPDILLYTSNDGTWYANPEIHRELFEWYCAYRDSSFRRIAMVDIPFDGNAVYHWSGDTAIHPTNPENYFELCVRK